MSTKLHTHRDKAYPEIIAKLHPQIALCYQHKFLNHLQAATLAGFECQSLQLRLLRCLDRHIFNDAVLKVINSGASIVELPDGEVCFLPSRKAHPPKYPNTSIAA